MAKFAGVAEETTWRTPVTATEWLDIVSESVNPEQGWIDVDTAQDVTLVSRVPGPYLVSGSLEMIVNPDNITKLLKWLMGAVTSTQDGTNQRWKHEFKPDKTFKSFTLELAPEVETKSRQIAGCVVRSLALEAPAREIVTASVDVLGAKDKQIDPSTPTFSALRPFVFFDGGLSLGGSPVADVEAFTCTLSRDIPDDIHVLGDRWMPDATKRGQRFTVEGSMDVAFLTWSLYKRFWGGAAVVEPALIPAFVALDLNLIGDTLGGSGDYANYACKVNLPRCTLNTSEANFDRRDRIVQSLGFSAVYDPTAAYAAKVMVVNAKNTP